MPSLLEVQTWAKKFREAYPSTLAERLEWWAKVLGINRATMLRLMKFGPKEVERLRPASWSAIVSEAEEPALWIDNLLVELLSLYSYNWQALSSDLHTPRQSGVGVKTKGPRSGDDVERLSYVPPEGSDRILLNRIADGGYEALASLVGFLSFPRDEANGKRIKDWPG